MAESSMSDDDSDGEPTPSEGDVEPDTSAGDDDLTEPETPDINVAFPSIPIAGGEGPDAGVEPEPSMAAEPEPAASSEPTAEPETMVEPAVMPEPVTTVEPGVTPEPVAEPEAPVEPETMVEPAVMPEPVVQPEPVMEPVPEPEPAPDPCANLPQCDLVCPAGTVNPIDANGCVDSCDCTDLPVACQDCASDEQCVETFRDGMSTYTCAGVVDGCVNILPCGCFEDYGNCTMGLQGLCQCEIPPDPCGGCTDGKRCIYQVSGQTGPRYVCATVDECEGPSDCECIEQQGNCEQDPERGVCACGWDGGIAQ
jgi:hypothetical protein